MITTYFYAQRNDQHQKGISSFSITVREDEDGRPDQRFKLMQGKADEAAKEHATPDGGAPVMVGHAGIPDVVVVIRAGEVFATFYRNSAVPPCLVVHDLDDHMIVSEKGVEGVEVEYVEQLQKFLSDNGYARCNTLEVGPV